MEKEVKTAVESCYGSVSTRLVFTSKRMLPVARKNILPTTQKSFVIPEYKCCCDSWYVGRTSQLLQGCMKQHVSKWLRQQLTCPRRSQPYKSCERNDTKPDCDFAIGQYLLDNDQCVLNYDNKRFSTPPLQNVLQLILIDVWFSTGNNFICLALYPHFRTPLLQNVLQLILIALWF